jgi:hypothetical protein
VILFLTVDLSFCCGIIKVQLLHRILHRSDFLQEMTQGWSASPSTICCSILAPSKHEWEICQPDGDI